MLRIEKGRSSCGTPSRLKNCTLSMTKMHHRPTDMNESVKGLRLKLLENFH